MKTINLNGVIGWDITTDAIQDFLKESNGDSVTVNISSPGGYVFDAFDMYNAIKDYKGETTCVCGSMAISCGSFLPLAFDNVVVHKNTMFMAHKVSGLAWGNVDEMSNEIELMKGMESIVDSIYAEKDLGIELATLGNKEEWVIGGEKLKELGFADSVIDEDSEGEEDKSTALVAYHAANQKIKDKFEKEKVSDRLKQIKNQTAKSNKKVNQEKEGSTMNLTKLKNEHPAVYAEVMQAGADEERGRVDALLVFIDSSPKEVKDAIADGTQVTAKLQMELMKKDNEKRFADAKLNSLEEENVEDVETPEKPLKVEDPKDGKSEEEAKFEKEFMNKFGAM